MSMFADRDPAPYKAEVANPYQSPVGPLGNVPPATFETAVFRDGTNLVIHEQAILPDKCIRTNEPTDGYRIRKTVTWHHPALLLLIFISPLIFIIVALIVQKRAKLTIPITKEVHFRSWVYFAIAWILVLVGTPTFIAGISNAGRFDAPAWAGPLALLGIIVLLVGLVLGVTKSPILKVRKIKDKFVWLKGVHPDFLAKLPEKPPFLA